MILGKIHFVVLDQHSDYRWRAQRKWADYSLQHIVEPEDVAGTAVPWKTQIEGVPFVFPAVFGLTWNDQGGLEDTIEELFNRITEDLKENTPPLLATLHHGDGQPLYYFLRSSPNEEEQAMVRVPIGTASSILEGAIGWALSHDHLGLAPIRAYVKATELNQTLPDPSPSSVKGPRF